MIKISKNHILAILAAALAVACAMSVYAPIHFGREQAVRERAVKERLVKIRHAEEQYRKDTGAYTDDFGVLVSRGYLPDSLQYIPYSEGRKFSITVTTLTGKSGRPMPLMECGAQYADYLTGLDEGGISGLTEEAVNAGRYPGLKIGDITTPNDNAGNWE